MPHNEKQQALPVVVLISGSGSNLQAIIDAVANQSVNANIKAVISNRPGVLGLERAQTAGIPTQVIDHKDYPDRRSFELELEKVIDSYEPQLIVLAGFMRILTPEFVNHYLGRMINIHPSLLPNFQGLHTHQRAIDAGVKEHGASIHFVTPELDGGPVVLQAKVTVLADDTPQALAARVLTVEHQIYPQAIEFIAQQRLHLKNNQAYLDDQIIEVPTPLEPNRESN